MSCPIASGICSLLSYIGTLSRCPRCSVCELQFYSLARLTLYLPVSITLIMKSGFIDFVRQSAAWVAVSIQSTLSPPQG